MSHDRIRASFDLPMSVSLFRAVPLADGPTGQVHTRRDTVRLPLNVPYIVDNLWEFLRPNHMPCRRHAAYASTSPELALVNASANNQGQGYAVHRLHFDGPARTAQLLVKDAREHPDIARVQKLLQKRCETWRTSTIEQRRQLSPLFLPAAMREDWLSAIEASPFVGSLVDELAASSFWSEARSTPANDNGELFFELLPGSSYTLGERVA